MPTQKLAHARTKIVNKTTFDSAVTVIKAVAVLGAKKATKYVSATSVVKASFHGKRRISRMYSVLLTYGKPNYAERAFIAKHVKSGGKFPIANVQIKW